MILRAVVVALAAGCAPALAGELAWEDALDRTANSSERILVQLTASWCEDEDILDGDVLADPLVALAIEGWLVVHVDVERRPDLHRLFHARGHEGLPTLLFLDSSGRELERAGVLDPAELARTLSRLGAEVRRGEPLLPAKPGTRPRSTAAEMLARGRRHLLGVAEAQRLTAVETDFLIRVARSDPATFAPGLAAAAAADPERADSSGVTACAPPPSTLAFRTTRLEVLVADAQVSPASAERHHAEATRTVEFLIDELLDPDTALFAAGLDDPTPFLGGNARAAAALVAAGKLWGERPWVRIGERALRAIPGSFTDDMGLCRWRSRPDRGEAHLEDWTEWGMALLASDSPDDRAKAHQIARTIRQRFVATGGRLLARTEAARSVHETADPGDDAARTVLFLARTALQVDDGALTFVALELLPGLESSRPACGPAAKGLAAFELARE
ncbi:MAG: thioredoxin family protein [Candidatus Eiseniibacteriota bacterium]